MGWRLPQLSYPPRIVAGQTSGIIEPARWRPRRPSPVQAAVALSIVVRVAIVAFLAFGPVTDEPAELAGWDAERFQEIADRTGQAWVDEPVEYPPGSVVVLDAVAGSDVVDTHRRLVILGLVVDLATAAALARWAGRRVAGAYLILGLALVPLGYQRLDTIVTGVAVAAALVGGLATTRPRPDLHPGPRRLTGLSADLGPATLIAVGALIKVWPLVLVVGAVAAGRIRLAVAAVIATTAGGVAWLLALRHGLDPVDQVLSLRGATGWHVESLPGAVVAALGDEPARLELNAYRIGDLRPALVSGGRVVAVAVMGALAGLGWLATVRNSTGGPGPSSRFAIATLGATAALLVTAPLLSPQFLIWTTPWAALLMAGDDPGPVAPGRSPLARPTVLVTGAASLLTGAVLTGFGPAGLTSLIPALALTTRNLALITLVGLCLAALAQAADLTPRGTTVPSPVPQPTEPSSEPADR